MKRGDIQTGVVYGYSEDRAHISHYSAVLVLSLDSYYRPRYGSDRDLQPASEPRERLNRGGWRTNTAPVGLLALSLYEDGQADLDRVRELATVENALRVMNNEPDGPTRALCDGVNAQTGQPVVLGRYMLVTSAGDLHGLYGELVAVQEEHKRLVDQETQRHEEARLAALDTFRALGARVEALGLDPDYRSDYEHPGHYRLNFTDLATLLDMAEASRRYAAASIEALEDLPEL